MKNRVRVFVEFMVLSMNINKINNPKIRNYHPIHD